MKITVKIVLTSLICFCFFTAKAQPQPGAGCMTKTNPNRVYQTLIGYYYGTPVYQGWNTQYSEWTTQYDITDYPCFNWTQTSSNGCYIKFSQYSSTLTTGNYGNFTGTSGTTCLPLDDYIPLLALLLGGVAFFYIKRVGIISG